MCQVGRERGLNSLGVIITSIIDNTPCLIPSLHSRSFHLNRVRAPNNHKIISSNKISKTREYYKIVKSFKSDHKRQKLAEMSLIYRIYEGK